MIATLNKTEGTPLVFMLHSDSRVIHTNWIGDDHYHEAHAFESMIEARAAFWRLTVNVIERGVYHW